jgi:hypothetical protein
MSEVPRGSSLRLHNPSADGTRRSNTRRHYQSVPAGADAPQALQPGEIETDRRALVLHRFAGGTCSVFRRSSTPVIRETARSSDGRPCDIRQAAPCNCRSGIVAKRARSDEIQSGLEQPHLRFSK